MERRSDDPAYQMHEMKRPTREREGPRTDAAGQEDRGMQDENSSEQVTIRQNANQRPPSEVREEERQHGSPDAVTEEQAEG